MNGPADAAWTIALAHGAGAGMDTPFMGAVAESLAAHGYRVVRFEFPYMQSRRGGATRRAPDRLPVLCDAWRALIETLGTTRLIIGGKSMGGRVASLVADETRVAGLVCLGYPFHPPGKPGNLRVSHLEKLDTPALIVQGTRDPFGTREEVSAYALSRRIRVRWLEDGDHSFKPRARSGRTFEQNLGEAVDAVHVFAETLNARSDRS